MRTGDTIAAVSSPPGRSRRAIIRLSGPQAYSVVAGVLESPTEFDRVARPVRLSLESDRALPVMALCFPAPRSFTGEDVLELLVPGNPLLCERILARLFERGARAAEPGEFTARAFLNGRLSVEQAEGVGMAIAARSAEQVEAAERLMTGATGAEYRRLADDLAQSLALVEAGIDFTDEEDVVAITPADLGARIRDLIDRAEGLTAGAREPLEGEPVVVLAGPPNAGKSTLFNALLERRRSVVAEEPGVTRDVIREPLDLGGEFPGGEESNVLLVDLAGLDEAIGARSQADLASQEAAAEEVGRADVLLLCDPEGRFETPPVVSESAVLLRVRTKADLPTQSHAPSEDAAHRVCALDGWGLAALRRAIADAARQSQGGAALTVLPRHRRALGEMLRSLGAAREAIDESVSDQGIAEPEMVAASLRSALDAVGEIAGRIAPDDVIGRIFATFCIGK